MSNMTRYGLFTHLRSEPNFHVIRYRNGRKIASGKGLAFWFMPIGTSVAEVPTDDRELQFIFQGRSQDFQSITVQGELTYRISDPEVLAQRVDFSIDLKSGLNLGEPIVQLATLFTGTAQKHAIKYLALKTVRELITEGPEYLQQSIEAGFTNEPVFEDMGLQMVSLRVVELKPIAELEKALQVPTRESIQQNADEATFERRALAVEKESAIAENELQNRIDLATRKEQLIAQEGQNERRRIQEEAAASETSVKARLEREQLENEALVTQGNMQAEAEAQQARIQAAAENDGKRLEAKTRAQNRRTLGAAEAEALRAEGLAEADKVEAVGLAEATGVKERMTVYENLSANVVFALALQEVAGKLKKIEHINITPDVLQTNLADLFNAGAQSLQQLGKK
ncbi:MAG: band 7 protein [Gammaproteobacteria bacterium]|nr:band 7 protein [Gammaproteobacteria bacterium]